MASDGVDAGVHSAIRSIDIKAIGINLSAREGRCCWSVTLEACNDDDINADQFECCGSVETERGREKRWVEEMNERERS